MPSKIFLDDPIPQQAAVVRACAACNNGLSAHEEYLACTIDVALAGTTEPGALRRKVRGILEHSPGARQTLRTVAHRSRGHPPAVDRAERVAAVLVKLAKGHALYELHEPQYLPPTSVHFTGLHTFSPAQLEKFEAPAVAAIWPEVGSRAMQRLAEEGSAGWVVVQPGRYRFLAQTGGPVLVRMVLSEYLAAEVTWDP
ncbi:MAG TPA: hypothetical protein VEK78_12965 [Gemmatimonadales bacterium]|nr:hypothetical protein [Gemmatimonadales bacterium]